MNSRATNRKSRLQPWTIRVATLAILLAATRLLSAQTVVQATVDFPSTNAEPDLNPAFCGLSYEKNVLLGHLFVATDTNMINVFRQIAPAVLRIGGNSVDRTCWGGLSNTAPITASQVDALAGFVNALPANWRVIYGINMAVNTPTNCAAEAAYAAQALGPHLLGFEIGNEPDLYHSNGIRPSTYTYGQYLIEWRALATAIIGAVPGWAGTNDGHGWTLVGPASANNTQGYTVPFAGDEAGVISMVTQHYYRANGQSPSSTLELLLQPDSKLPGTVSNIVAAATAANLPLGFRMDECGSFYNGGAPNVSDAYGTALWTLDFMFTLALNGCQGVNFHGGGSGPGYTPIADNGTTVVQVRPEFYGLKMFSLVSRGRLVPTAVALGSNINFTAYGVRQSNGGIGAVLINKETNVTVRVTLNPGTGVTAAQSMELTGPDLNSTNGYTLGGAPINPDGSWAGGYQSASSATNGQLTVLVPPITAILLDPVVPPSACSASTETPASVSASAATLRGLVVPNGTNTSAWFDWGTTAAYGHQTAPTAVGNSYQVTPCSAAISGLTPGRIYHCRLSASNGLATVHGFDQLFTTGGRVKAWGAGNLGQTNVPAGLTNAVMVASGFYHGLALKNDGTVDAWGDNNYGQASVPAGLSNVIALVAGATHSVALKADGTVMAWGADNYGQVDVPTGLTNVVTIAAGAAHNLALTQDGRVVAWGWDLYGQTAMPGDLYNVVRIAAGLLHSLALKADGTVVAWGNDVYGQTDVPAGLTQVVAVAAGQYHCLALKSDGTVSAWGRNNAGQTNVPPGLTNVTAIACGQNYCLALQSDGSVVAWGDGGLGQTNLPAGLVKVAQLTGGMNSGFAIADQLPQAASQSAAGYVNHDLEITLSATSPDGNPLSYRITTLPAAGSLYQDASGVRGNWIGTPETAVTDPGQRVIFAPALNGLGQPYAAFGFVVNDGEYDSTAAQVTVNIGLPLAPVVGQFGWLGQPGGTDTFGLSFSGSTNATYSLLISTNLLDWEEVGTVPEIAPGQYQFLDTAATNRPLCFYRLRGP